MSGLIQSLIGLVSMIEIRDIIDILMVAFLMYQSIKLVRDTKAMQLIKGLIALVILNVFVSTQELKTMSFIMKNVLQIGAMALLVVFQPELRRALEHVGRTSLSRFNFFAAQTDDVYQNKWRLAITSIGDAFRSLSATKTGALVVIERENSLVDIIKTGTMLDAIPSEQLIGNIFFHNSPLHDGALVIQDGKLASAGCFLPLSENYQISKELGTRHRAALGMSERSDAIILVVSEETGVISMAREGKLFRGLTPEKLVDELSKLIIPEKKEEASSGLKPLIMKVKR